VVEKGVGVSVCQGSAKKRLRVRHGGDVSRSDQSKKKGARRRPNRWLVGGGGTAPGHLRLAVTQK